jgi:type IV secretion system protein VirB8
MMSAAAPFAARKASLPAKGKATSAPSSAASGGAPVGEDPPYSHNHGFEMELLVERERSRRLAWWVACTAVAISALAVLAVVAHGALYQTVPIPLVVDKATGEVTVGKALQADTVPAYEALDKHNALLFVLARERYNWSFLQMDYDAVAALASPAVFKEYGSQFEGPAALQKKLGDGVEWKVRVVNIRLEPQTKPGQAGVAVVTFVKQVIDRQTGAEPEVRYVATVSYEYHPKLQLKEKDRLQNPFGCEVTAYRADPDINSTGKAGT